MRRIFQIGIIALSLSLPALAQSNTFYVYQFRNQGADVGSMATADFPATGTVSYDFPSAIGATVPLDILLT